MGLEFFRKNNGPETKGENGIPGAGLPVLQSRKPLFSLVGWGLLKPFLPGPVECKECNQLPPVALMIRGSSAARSVHEMAVLSLLTWYLFPLFANNLTLPENLHPLFNSTFGGSIMARVWVCESVLANQTPSPYKLAPEWSYIEIETTH